LHNISWVLTDTGVLSLSLSCWSTNSLLIPDVSHHEENVNPHCVQIMFFLVSSSTMSWGLRQ
jgi:hypothetical protein